MHSLLTEPRALTRKEVPRVRNLQTPIVLNKVFCRNTFIRLDECLSNPVEYCDHTNDAGAFCTNIRGWCVSTFLDQDKHNCVFLVVCNDSNVRLFGGETKSEGRVELCSMGRWTLVCRDFWDNNDAQVVCRQLGYNVEGELSSLASLMM